MPANTTRLQLPYPVLADPADVPKDIQALAAKLDPNTGWTLSGTLAARPAAGTVPDRTVYFATDTHALSVALAGNWLDVVPPDASITSAKIVDGTIAQADLGFSAARSLQGYTQMASGFATFNGTGQVLVNHGMSVTAQAVLWMYYALGPVTGSTPHVSYDVPNSTQVRFYDPENLTFQFRWVVWG